MQKLTLIGNVGADAVIRTPKAGGEQFMSFKIACNESYINREGAKVEETNWYDCIYKRVKLAPFIKKGDQIHVEGKPEYSIYQDREGKSAIAVNISVTDICLFNNRREANAAG